MVYGCSETYMVFLMLVKRDGEWVCACVLCGVSVHVNKYKSVTCSYCETVGLRMLEEVYVSSQNVPLYEELKVLWVKLCIG